MTDLVCVVADKQIRAAVSGLLERPAALGIRPITSEILLHPEHDPGCFHRPAELLRGYRQTAEHALIVLDHKWDGVPTTSGAELEPLIDKKFRNAGMADWAAPVVIDPELEAWVFGASPRVAEVLGWKGPGSLRKALERWGFWKPDVRKPADPKAALERVLKTTGKSHSAPLFRSLARRVKTRDCQDRAFMRLRSLLQAWFPPDSSGSGADASGGSSPSGANAVEHNVKTRRKLIEVALPLDGINAASAREKSIRHGHPSTLHLWWARKPLAAARAVIFSQMVDDPSAHPDRFPTEKAQEEERERLFGIIRELVRWENTNNETVLEWARKEIRESWRRTCLDNADHPRAAELFDPDRLPAFHDPFAGGGALPLEAQRLGLEAHASDLNPVAVLINKAMIEIPPRFAGRPPVNPDARAEFARGARWHGKGAQGLAEDVRYYGQWMRDEAEKRTGHLYPNIEMTEAMAANRPDLKRYVGRKLTVIAWLWARTVKSPNPVFADVDVPLASTFMLSTKKGKEAYVEPVVDGRGYCFTVKVGAPPDADAAKAGTKLSRGANFRCLMSGTPIAGDYIKAESMARRMGARLMAIVAEGDRGRVYLAPATEHEETAGKAIPGWQPDQPLPDDPRNFWTIRYGLKNYADLFTSRQLAALTTFSDLVGEATERVRHDATATSLPDDDRSLCDGGAGAAAYAEAVALYLGLAISRTTDTCNSLCRWQDSHERVLRLFGRQAIPMVWRFAEPNPFAGSFGDLTTATETIATGFSTLGYVDNVPTHIDQADAHQASNFVAVRSTDPPYYDNIGYADLSDFFYVWLRHCLKPIFPKLFCTLAVPKADELVASPYRHGGKDKAEIFFLDGMKQVLHRLSQNWYPGFPVTIYYAFKQAENRGSGIVSTGWEMFLEAVIAREFTITGTWPVRTELESRSNAIGTNALASSIVLACRRRPPDTPATSRRDFLAALRSELPLALAELQKSNIAPVDFAQAAIGPGMAIFTRYARVLEADGSPMPVRSALVEINRTLDETLARQEGDLDPDTRFCVAWYEQYGTGERAYGEAEVLFSAKNTSFEGLQRAGVVVGGKGKVRLRRRDELDPDWNPATDRRITDWESAQHLTRSLTAERGGGVAEAARLVLGMGAERAEKARALAYRLYSLAERKRWTDEARAYNVFVTSWPQIQAEAARLRAGAAEQAALGLSAGSGS